MKWEEGGGRSKSGERSVVKGGGGEGFGGSEGGVRMLGGGEKEGYYN